MVICRPEHVGTSMWYKEILSDSQHNIVVQEYTFIKTVFNPAFRIIVHQGLKGREKHYQVATSDTREEIYKDWTFIQSIISSKADNESDIVDPALALVSLIFSRWKQTASSSSHGESDFVIQRVDHPPSTPTSSSSSSLHPPVHPDSQLHHSKSDPGLSHLDATNQNNQNNQGNQDNQNQPANNSHIDKHSNGDNNNINNPRTPPQLSHSNSTPSLETNYNYNNNNVSRANPPPKPASVLRQSAFPPSFSSPPPSRFSYSASSPVISSPSSNDVPPSPIHISGELQPTKENEKETRGHETQNGKETERRKEGGEYKDSEVVAEIMAWEKRKSNLQSKMDALMKKKSAHMQGIINDYLEAIRGIVMDEAGLTDNIKMKMISQECILYGRRKKKRKKEKSLNNVFNTKSCAIITCVEEQIKTTERAGKMKKSVIKLQALTRGFLVRKKYKSQIKSQRHRNKCVRELLETERTYVRQLELLVEVFLQPLRTSSNSRAPLIRKEDVNVLFSNIESLLAMNTELLNNLEQRLVNWGSKSLVGDILIRLAPYMKLYTQYVNSYNDALNTLNKYSKSLDFQEFLTQKKSNPKLKSMDIASFLILPVQRVPRYVLLLQEIVKLTPATHPDSANLNKALEMIQEVARTINESKRQAENTNKVMAIQSSILVGNDKMEDLVQPHRKFRKEGALVRDVESSLEDCYIFLFSDMLLITQKRKGFLDESYHYIYKDILKFTNAMARSIPDTRLWQHGFSVTSPAKSERFFADTDRTKNEWLAAITEVIDEVKKNRQTLKVEVEPPPPVIEVPEEQQPTTPTHSNPPTSSPSPSSLPPSSAPSTPSSSSLTPQLPTHSSFQGSLVHHPPSPSSSTSSHRQSINLSLNISTDPKNHASLKLKQVVALYRQALQLESEMFFLPYQIRTLLPSLPVTPQNIQELQSRITLLNSRLTEIDGIHDNVMFIIREEKAVITLDRLIKQGLVHIDSMLKYLTATFPKEMAPTPGNRNSIRQSSGIALTLPYQLMSSILSWYLSVTDNWTTIMEKQV